jgi:hypothetical protein
METWVCDSTTPGTDLLSRDATGNLVPMLAAPYP